MSFANQHPTNSLRNTQPVVQVYIVIEGLNNCDNQKLCAAQHNLRVKAAEIGDGSHPTCKRHARSIVGANHPRYAKPDK